MNNVTSRLGARASRIAEQLDDIGHQAAEGLHTAASSIRKGGQHGSEAIEDLTKGTAARLDRAGSFIEDHDLKHAIGGSRQFVRRYPVETLVLAAGVGFLTGLAILGLAHSFVRTVTRTSA
jgi:ElaB/YqjD/DUF883 family membrane-anchored ribosome-binding protein